mgnify:CR=1 FL=1
MGKSSRAGVVLPVPRVERAIRDAAISKSMSSTCGVFLAGVVEEIVSKLVAESAASVRADPHPKKRITLNDIMKTAHADLDLGRMLANFGHASTAVALGEKGGYLDFILPIDEQRERQKQKKESAMRRRDRMQELAAARKSNAGVAAA